MAGRLIEEDLFTKYSILDNSSVEGQKIHNFLKARAEKLAGRYINFEEMPVTFVMSDSDTPNAFFASAPNPDPDERPRRDEYKTIRHIKNPLETSIVCVTKGLIKMVDNLDQLDFVLGHELTHMLMRSHEIKHNSKGEEELADLHSVDLMYDAGSDPKQALIMSEKLSAYTEEEEKKRPKKRRRHRDEDEEEGLNWSEIFDVHMTDSNRKAGIEASLTRLSHLIDDKTPTEIDKKVFDVSYSDPIDVFLKEHNYEGKKSLGKLKLLVDCIDHISVNITAEDFFQSEIDALPKENSEWLDFRTQRKRQELQERIDAGFKDYFSGQVVDKKYQQKIANLAEGIIKEVENQRKQKGNSSKPAKVNTKDLNLYLQEKAYQHIDANGYPKAGDLNYQHASGVLYSYFNYLFAVYSPQDDDNTVENRPKIEFDIDDEKEKIRKAETAEEFIDAAEELKRLSSIRHEIRETSFGYNGNGDKLDNLSPINDYRMRSHSDEPDIYNGARGGNTVPWNNLIEIAAVNEKTKDYVVTFLAQNHIIDYRLTHGLPYVEVGYSDCYTINESGRLSDNKILEYELDFAIHSDLVLGAYDYIKAYFDNEQLLIEEKSAAVINLNDADFVPFEVDTDTLSTRSIAKKKIYDFISMFNALPDDNQKENAYSPPNAISFIPEEHKKEHLIPGTELVKSSYRSDNIKFKFSKDLLDFQNPIFQEHFGEGYKQTLLSKKEQQQQQMFDTSFSLLGRAVDIWLEAKPKLDELNERSSELSREMWNSTDKAFKTAKEAERELLQKDIVFYKEKEEQTSSLIYNSLRSIFKGDKYWYHLQRLRPEQKKAIADFAVKDEKGSVMPLFNEEGYEHFCDYLGILDEQTGRVLSGDYQLSEYMKVIAGKYGYQQTTRKESFITFADGEIGKKYGKNERKYAWYLNIFDTMQYLEKTPSIDVRTLSVALTEIEQASSSCQGNDPRDIVEARHLNYRKFINKSNVVALASRAIDHKENYQELSFDELLATADSLIKMRNKIKDGLEGTVDHQKFLHLVDKNARGLLRKAEHVALQNDDALEKITGLYKVYNAENESFSNESKRTPYTGEINKKEHRRDKISALFEDTSFWPSDALEHVKAYVFALNTFLDDKDLENEILNNILEKLEVLPSGKKKNECLHVLLDKNLRAAYPETRERLFEVYTNDVTKKLGKDDGSARYQRRLANYLKAFEEDKSENNRFHRNNDKEKTWDIGKKHGQSDGLLSNTISVADKYTLLRRLSDEIISQEQTSQMVKESCQIKLNSEDMLKSYLYGIGVDYLTEEMDSDADVAKKFLHFLNSKGEEDDCKGISSYLDATMRKKYPKWKDRLEAILGKTQPTNCKILYENFWSAPIEARAVIIARILKSTVNSDAANDNNDQHSWERVFDVVMDNIISPDDESKESKYARDIMHSYIKSRSNYERELILSAMMVANRNIGGDAGNIGKALKLFLENMGPAEIKLGQAIASHPDTPNNIRVELQKLKNSADMPARWTLYDWIKAENIPEKLWKGEYLGVVLGSASYYTTVALGENKVLRMLRPEAREKAIKGFRVIGDTIEDLKAKDENSDLDYNDLTSSVTEMVTQAARMSNIETDHEIGQKQYEDAQKIYNGVTIGSGAETFTLKVMDWNIKGKNWIVMDRADGSMFNDLSEETPEQVLYKKSFAKSYIVFEIMNILSGGKFDHDRHGAQLCLDKETNEAGIFDTGAMALNAPTPEQQHMLGHIIYDVIKSTMNSMEPFSALSASLNDKIEELHKNDIDTQYLVEVKKGLLALGDFFKVLDEDDLKSILPDLEMLSGLSKHVGAGAAEKMTLIEKAQVKVLMTSKLSAEYNAVTITRTMPDTTSNVANVNVTPAVQSKASWFQHAFIDSEKKDGGNYEVSEQRKSPSEVRVFC